MHDTFHKLLLHPTLAIGSTLLWGVLEFFALQRSRRANQISHTFRTTQR